ncbi:MAG: type II toxin-antitoxin system VapC family toxin [Acidobacteria bacterium]|nr:type II toxin-antitoxin system VapC family toxin [Acidobacteriota bacterium]
MSARVIDASVMAAVAFGEPRRDEAVALVHGAEVLGPTLLAYELTHVACKKCRARPDEAVHVASQLSDALTLTDRWLEVDAGEVLALALVWGLSAYDASYLWLAAALKVPLVTFDRQLAAVAAKMGLS